MAKTSASSKTGFTVIELLAAMTILIFIVLMMTRIFTDVSESWSVGTRRVQTAAEGRVIMDFIVKELTQAIADDVVTFKTYSGPDDNTDNYIPYGTNAYGSDSDELCYVAGVRPPPGVSYRNSHQFAYFVAPMLDEYNVEMTNRFRLIRTRKTSSLYSSFNNMTNSAYRNREWWKTMTRNIVDRGETIAENVAGFEVWAYSEQDQEYAWSYNSARHGNVLPLWLDIYLELLSDADAERAALLWSAAEQDAAFRQPALDFISQNVKRFNARVFFPNRERAKAFN